MRNVSETSGAHRRAQGTPLFIVIGGFAFGIALQSLYDFGSAFTFFLLLVATVFFGVFFSAKMRVFLFVALFFVSAVAGIWRYVLSDLHQGDPVLEERAGDSVLLEGIVSEPPDERAYHTILTVDMDSVETESRKANVDSRARVTVEHYPVFEYGDRISLRGVLEKPENFENEETGNVFDYVSYLGKDGIFYELKKPVVERLARNRGNPIKGLLFKIEGAFLSRIDKLIPEPESALLGGLLVGAKQSLGEKLLDDFRIAGVIHIVVLSGYNLTIVAEAIMRFLSFAPRLWGISLGSISIMLFAVMTGAGATVVRASLMALLALLARATGRTYEITLALFLAGFFMLFANPKVLVFDPSFQLSFLATLGLIYFSPLVEKRLAFLTKTFGVREIVAATIATQIFVLPLLLYMTGVFSVVSLPANLLILPFVPFIMLMGFLTGVVGFVSFTLALPLALIAGSALSYVLAVTGFFAHLPYAAFSLGAIPSAIVLLWYLCYGIVIGKMLYARN